MFRCLDCTIDFLISNLKSTRDLTGKATQNLDLKYNILQIRALSLLFQRVKIATDQQSQGNLAEYCYGEET